MKNRKLSVISPLFCLVLLAGCEKHVHEYAAETVPACCETAGAVTYTCACGDSYTETVPAPGHAWDRGTTVVEASCKEEGKIAYTCTVCKAIREEVLEKTDVHTFAPGVVTKEATCGEPGTFTQICTLCAKEKTDEIAPTGKHTYGELTVTKAPTCKDEGEGEKTCTVCTHKTTESVPKTDTHVWGTPTVLTAETCTAEGSEKVVCTVCEKEQTNVRSRSAHTYVSTGMVQKPDCATAGTESFRCTVCQATKTETVPPTEKHEWNVGLVVVQPTCRQNGSKLITCTFCRATKTEVVPSSADAHTWDSGKVTKKAICDIKGIKVYTCTTRKDTKQEFIAPSGNHTYKKTVRAQPTEEKEGLAEYTCTICAKSYEEVLPKLRPGEFYAGFDPYHMRTGHSDGNYVEFSISGNKLTVSGKIVKEGLEYVWVRCGDTDKYPDGGRTVRAKSGSSFSITVDIDHVTGHTPIRVYTHCAGDEKNTYWSYVNNTVAVTKEKGTHRLEMPAFCEDTMDTLASRPDVAQGLGPVDDSVKEFSDSLVKNEKDTYRKMQILHDWVAENIYYDYDYMSGRTASTWTAAADVLKHKNTMCVGLVNILADLLRAQGISCHAVKSTIYNVTAAGKTSVRTTGHVVLEAYLPEEDRWVLMDPTWTSKNRYENGKFIKNPMSHLYFDVSPEYISTSQCLTGFKP